MSTVYVVGHYIPPPTLGSGSSAAASRNNNPKTQRDNNRTTKTRVLPAPSPPVPVRLCVLRHYGLGSSTGTQPPCTLLNSITLSSPVSVRFYSIQCNILYFTRRGTRRRRTLYTIIIKITIRKRERILNGPCSVYIYIYTHRHTQKESDRESLVYGRHNASVHGFISDGGIVDIYRLLLYRNAVFHLFPSRSPRNPTRPGPA